MRPDIDWQWQVAARPLDPATAANAEAVLLENVANGVKPATARIWRSHRCLVVPASQAREKPFAAASADLLQAGWPVIVRRSGGSPVPLDPGMLNLSLVFPLSPDQSQRIDDGFHLLSRILIAALTELGLQAVSGEVPDAFCAGRFDLSVGGRKIAGTAQHWRAGLDAHGRRRQTVLAHAVLLVDPDLRAGSLALAQWERHFGTAKLPLGDAITSLRLALADAPRSKDRLTSNVIAAIRHQIVQRPCQPGPDHQRRVAV